MSVGAKGEDLKCYRGIIYRIQQGEGYYQAAHAELSSRGYPTKSVFNWRLPFLGWLLWYISNRKNEQSHPNALIFVCHMALDHAESKGAADLQSSRRRNTGSRVPHIHTP